MKKVGGVICLNLFLTTLLNFKKDLNDNLNVFNKLVQDIVSIDEIVFGICNVIILLNFKPDNYNEGKKFN